jgi:hypothetical protein
LGVPGCADQSPKFHQGLIEVPWEIRIHQGAGHGLQSSWRWGRFVQKSGEHAANIAIHGRNRTPKSDGGHGTRCVSTDSREGEKFFRGLWQEMAHLREFLREALQVSSASVIAKPLPRPQNLILRCTGQGWEIGELLHPPPVIGHNGIDTGLL